MRYALFARPCHHDIMLLDHTIYRLYRAVLRCLLAAFTTQTAPPTRSNTMPSIRSDMVYLTVVIHSHSLPYSGYSCHRSSPHQRSSTEWYVCTYVCIHACIDYSTEAEKIGVKTYFNHKISDLNVDSNNMLFDTYEGHTRL